MRLVIREDVEGYKHGSLVRDEDTDEMAEYGVQINVPDIVNKIDWRLIAQQIHNQLTEHHLFTWDDVLKKQQEVNINSIVQSVLKRQIIALYRDRGEEDKVEFIPAPPSLVKE